MFGLFLRDHCISVIVLNTILKVTMWWGQSADAAEQNPQPDNVEVRDLQDQFQSQQKLIVQLKEMLKSNEQQLLSKEKEVEVSTTTQFAITFPSFVNTCIY